MQKYGKDLAAMLALLKIARIASGHAKEDNWIDLAGYAACGNRIRDMSDAERCPEYDRLLKILKETKWIGGAE